jgi:hypothetical protein
MLQAKAMNDHRTSGDHDGRYYREDEFSTADSGNTPVIRDSAGDIRARLFRSTYMGLSSNIGVIYTSRTAGTDYMRPSTPVQVRDAMGLDGRYANLTGGANANFTAMPLVGGDPIVESGSNSDGEWTRFADGAQIASITRAIDYTGSLSSTTRLYFAGQAWARPFIVRPAGLTMMVPIDYSPNFIGCSRSDVTNWGLSSNYEDGSDFNASVFFTGGVSTSNGEITNISFLAIGRWK